MSSLKVTEVYFTAARHSEIDRGHLGYVSLVLEGALKLDGISLRLTRDGRRALSFPRRRDRYGVDHAYIRPLSDRVRVHIERQVFEALGVGDVSR